MERADWQKVESIIDGALKLPAEKRSVFIEQQCKGNQQLKEEVTTLLESIFDSQDWFDDLDAYKKNFYREISEDLQALPSKNTFIGETVGSFTIKEQLGQGGMGVVYLAERTDKDFEHRVAIKIIHEGKDTKENIRRFRSEQRILAGLNHPGIAHLYDGGFTKENSPYIIMEYVPGVPIDVYYREHHCTIDERISLFKQVLEAVRYAHENLIIHRDLKPGNILVDESGQVKILDFGISKLLNQKEEAVELPKTGARLLTPKYAAPEQIEQKNITTATDMYALGTVFYELLADKTPFNFDSCSPHEMERIILEQKPALPSYKVSSVKVQKQLRGDLDAIALKALQKEPDKRYRVANEFLDDLNNYQDKIPVSAVKHTNSYRLKKFFLRHHRGVAITTGIVLLMMVIISLFTWKIAKERNTARLEATKSQNISNFLMDLFEANDPTKALGDTITARMLLQRGVNRAESLQKQPKVRALMYDVIGQVYRRLGQYDRSHKLLQHAVDLRRQYYGPQHPETAASLDHLGLLFCDMGTFKKAEDLLRKSLAIRQRHAGSNQLALAKTEGLLAYSLRRQGDYKSAESLYKRSLSIRRSLLDANDPRVIESISRLGATLHNEGNYKHAEQLFREALEKRRELLGPVHPDIAMSLNNLGTLLMNIGEPDEAESLLKESLAMRRKIYGPKHPKVALTMNNLAIALRDKGHFAAAGSLFNQALAMRQELLAPHHIATALTQYSIAGLMLETNQPDSALALYRQALPVFVDKLSAKHSFTARTWMGMGSAYLEKGNVTKAKHFLTKGFQVIKQIHPEGSLERALAEKKMGVFMLKTKQYAHADSLLTHCYHNLHAIEKNPSLRQQRVLALLNDSSLKAARGYTFEAADK